MHLSGFYCGQLQTATTKLIKEKSMDKKLKQTRTEVLSAYLETQVTDPIRSDLMKLINKIDKKIESMA